MDAHADAVPQPSGTRAHAGDPRPGLRAGAVVEVRNHFDGGWVRGFQVVDHDDAGYRLRRVSDGHELPAHFDPAELRIAS